MKHIIKEIKKYFCVILSIFLLLQNNYLFAQNIPDLSITQKQIEKDFQEVKKCYRRLDNSLQSMQDLLERTQARVSENSDFFKAYFQAFDKDVLEGRVPKIYGDFALQNKEYILDFRKSVKTIMYDYKNYLELLPDNLVQDKLAVQYLYNKLDILELDITKMSVELPDFEKDIDLIYALSKVKEYRKVHHSYKSILFEEPESVINKLAGNSEELSRTLQLSYALRSEKSKEAIKIVLQSQEKEEIAANIVNSIQYYLKKFNVKIRNRAKIMQGGNTLISKITAMTPKIRNEYVQNLLDLSPEERLLVKDINSTEKVLGKKIVGRAASKAMIIVGSVLIAFTITALTADNTFAQNSLTNQVDLINRIKNGEASIAENFQFFTNQRYSSLIFNDEELFAKMIDLYDSVKIADEDFEIILNTIDAAKIPELTTGQKENMDNMLNKHLNESNLKSIQDTIDILK